MSTDRDPHSEAPVPEAAPDDPTALPPGVVERQAEPTRFAAIEAEGTRERWLLARRTARSVFTDPALVTPRRMALLGEQGLAAFVDEVRSAARYLIRRERENLAAEPQPDAPAPEQTAESATEPEPAPQAARRRRPAAFRAPRPAPPVSILETLARRLRPGAALKRFAADTLIWSALLAAVLVGTVTAYRTFFLLNP